ncbi:MAG: hypothetical protein E6F99_01010 [Actinobacteria bacterium]|nr:MAG: hypothetical protein E6F99_01010 [Actinomycetota bacterium]
MRRRTEDLHDTGVERTGDNLDVGFELSLARAVVVVEAQFAARPGVVAWKRAGVRTGDPEVVLATIE